MTSPSGPPSRANLWPIAVGAALLGAGIAASGMLIGQGLAEMRRAERVVTVKGLSERQVEATLATWRIPYRGAGDSPAAAVAAAESAHQAIRDFAAAGGLAAGEVATEPYAMRIERVFVTENGDQREVTRYNAVGAVRMRTENVAAVEALVGRTQALLDAGVLIGDHDYGEAPKPQYLFTGLNAIKPALIGAATENARLSAQQFAEDSGSRVGAIASANQGVIQILPRDGDFDERAERLKTVRVVTTVRYFLED